MGFNFRPPERRVWKVRDLVAAVRSHIEREYSDAWVEGEISNFRAPDSGHLYFTLKDGNAQIRVVMFRSSARLLRFRPADGLQVVVRGRVTVYEDRGELQISAEYIEPKGAGSLQLAFEQLKAKLEAEGLFAAERKKPIPSLPSRIGVVTSAQAAALRDILNVLQRRHHSVNVLIYPAQVQGDAASLEVAAGVRYFNQHDNVDVIIVARGGGSAEDLAVIQQRSPGANGRRLRNSRDLRGRARNRFHHRRLRCRPARSHALGRGRVGHPLAPGSRRSRRRLARPPQPRHALPAADGPAGSHRTRAARRVRPHDGSDPPAPAETRRPHPPPGTRRAPVAASRRSAAGK